MVCVPFSRRTAQRVRRLFGGPLPRRYTRRRQSRKPSRGIDRCRQARGKLVFFTAMDRICENGWQGVELKSTGMAVRGKVPAERVFSASIREYFRQHSRRRRGQHSGSGARHHWKAMAGSLSAEESRKVLRQGFYDPDGLHVTTRVSSRDRYIHQPVKKDVAPKSLADLLDPKGPARCARVIPPTRPR